MYGRFIILLSFFIPFAVFGQNKHSSGNDTAMMEMGNMHGSDTMSMPSMQHDTSMMHMPHAYSLSLPMNRNGSGTGWLPDASVMYGHGVHSKKWMFMLHHNFFLRYNHQDLTHKSNRGGEKIDAPGWLMLMGQRRVGKSGLFNFSAMISLDPFTVGSEGYPLLFQSGETYQGKRLVDNQHPHDLISQLSAGYTHMISKDVDITAYFGYPGEPSLGPVAFMHRLSSINNPDATLGHHWQDATHISFGVATLGIRFGKVKIEGSAFTAREPDENRYDFDKPRFDSYSARLLFNPTRQLALQVSTAYLKSPEISDPTENTKRTTASIIHHLPFTKENTYLSSALIWGCNKSDRVENSVLLESNLQFDKTAIYMRYEYVQKDARELDLKQFIDGSMPVFSIQALTLGVSRVILRKYGSNIALGMQGSVFITPNQLKGVYGENPLSGEVYLRWYPHLMQMHNITRR